MRMQNIRDIGSALTSQDLSIPNLAPQSLVTQSL